MAEELRKTLSNQDAESFFQLEESEMKDLQDDISDCKDDSVVSVDDSKDNLRDSVLPPLVSFPLEDKNAIENLHKGVMVLDPRNIPGKETQVQTFLSGLENYKPNVKFYSQRKRSVTEPVYRAHGYDGETTILVDMPLEQDLTSNSKRKMPFSQIESQVQKDEQSIRKIVKPCGVNTGAIPKRYPYKMSPRKNIEVNVSGDDHKVLQNSPESESFGTSQTHELPHDSSNRGLGPSPTKKRRSMHEKEIVSCSPLNLPLLIFQNESSSDTTYPQKSLTPDRDISDDEYEIEETRRAFKRKISVDSSIASGAISPDISTCEDVSGFLFPSEINEDDENLIGPREETTTDNLRLVQNIPSSAVQDMQLHESPLDLSLSGIQSKEQGSFKIIQQKGTDSSDAPSVIQNFLPSTSKGSNVLSIADHTTECIEYPGSQMESIATGIEQMTLEQKSSPKSMCISGSSGAEEEDSSGVMKSDN